MTTTARRPALATASIGDTLSVAVKVLGPMIASGLVRRRRPIMRLAERGQWDRRAIDCLRALRDTHGDGPLRLRIPGRSVVMLLSARDLDRVLAETPSPFTPATREKRAALSTFQPHGVLISTGDERAVRREFTKTVLDTGQQHRFATTIARRVADEFAALHDTADRGNVIDWPAFESAWWRAVRRIVFGDAARDDETVTTLLESLRRSANWAYLGRARNRTRHQFGERLRERIRAAEPDSLAALAMASAADGMTCPSRQIPHWLFAFDAAGMATIRALALLATHPEHDLVARHEVARRRGTAESLNLPYLAACLNESLRLWPTTPILLRDSTSQTHWGATVAPGGTSFVAYTPFLHRDPDRLDAADRFDPTLWIDGAAERLGFVPFSSGPAVCPGRDLVLFSTGTAMAELLANHRYRLLGDGPLREDEPIPATLDPFTIRLAAESA